MKQVLIAILALMSVQQTLAQDSLTASNVSPGIWLSSISNVCDTTGITVGAGGMGTTWDYTGLVMTSMDTGTVVTCAATPNCSMFPGSNIAIKSISGTTVNYAISTSSAYSQNGYYYSSSQYATLSDPLDQLHFPMHYLDSFTDTYAGIITYTGTLPITAHENGVAIVSCDGYGTLKLPGSLTYDNTFRVHSYQLYVDSASVFGIDTVASFILNSYTWYKPGIHSPLLTILESDQVGGALHTKAVSYSTAVTLGLEELQAGNHQLDIYPNPATGMVKLHTDATDGMIEVYDIMGRPVATMRTNQSGTTTFDGSMLDKGIYTVRLQSGGATITKKLELY